MPIEQAYVPPRAPLPAPYRSPSPARFRGSSWRPRYSPSREFFPRKRSLSPPPHLRERETKRVRANFARVTPRVPIFDHGKASSSVTKTQDPRIRHPLPVRPVAGTELQGVESKSTVSILHYQLTYHILHQNSRTRILLAPSYSIQRCRITRSNTSCQHLSQPVEERRQHQSRSTRRSHLCRHRHWQPYCAPVRPTTRPSASRTKCPLRDS